MTGPEKAKQLLDEINIKREALNDAFVSEGFSDRMKALNKEMDQLINKYYQLIREENGQQ